MARHGLIGLTPPSARRAQAARVARTTLRRPTVVFLDRDGVLNDLIEGDYVRNPAQLVMRPGAAAAVARLNQAGIPVFVVTNQRGVSRGLFSETDLDDVHRKLRGELAREGASVQGIYACTHASDACRCRKPLPGLIEAVVADHPGLDLGGAVMVGDSDSDMALARGVGIQALRIGPTWDGGADGTAPTLARAVDLLLDADRPEPRAGTATRSLADRQLQLLTVLLYIDVIGQRLALPLGSTSQVPVGLIAGVAVVAIGSRRGLLRVDRARLRLALIALVAVCLSTLVLAAQDVSFSFLSLLLLILCYVPFVFIVAGDGDAVLRRLLGRFIKLMAVLAVVTILETVWQFAGIPSGDPLSSILPGNLLLTGYHTTYPFAYGSPYLKSNGIVFLEPSFCTQFLALAMLAHFWLRRRGLTPLLLLVAMVVTVTGTGFVLLGFGLVAIAIRGERVRGQAPVLRALLPAIVVGLIAAFTTSLGSIFTARLHEGTGGNSSTGERFFQPFSTLGKTWLDSVPHTLGGNGPGSAAKYLYTINGDIVALAPLKLVFEYGGIAAIPALLFILWSCISGARALPLTVGLLGAWTLLAGVLQGPQILIVMWLFTGACARPSDTRLAPVRTPARTVYPPALPRRQRSIA